MKHITLEKIIASSPHLSWLETNTIFLTKHGSHSYGTNIETSDDDFKGIAISPINYYLGNLNNFNQAELKDPDTLIYDIKKFFKLATDCNPSVIEVLFTEPEDHIIVTPLAQKILDNKNLFISKKAKHTFTGYAISQLKRIKTHRKWIINPPDHKPTRKEFDLPEHTLIPKDKLLAIQSMVDKELLKLNFDFLEDLDDSVLGINDDNKIELAAKKIGFDDNIINIIKKENAYSSRKTEWDQYMNWKQNRNPARAELEYKFHYDPKHAMHLVRLMRMGHEILETGKVNVKRISDREELISIRKGAWSYDQVIEFAEKEESIINSLYETSTIPTSPNRKEIDNLFSITFNDID